MENKELFKKYNKGKHWENHPTLYAEEFSKFLKKEKVKGPIIDIGCGNGRDVNFLKKDGFDAIGLDYIEEEVANAKKNYPQCKFEVQNVEKLNLKSESVSGFFMINVIHYVNKQKAINEIYKKLKKGGFFYIHFNLKIIDEKGNVDYEDNEEEIMNLISKFKIISKEIIKRTDNLPKVHTHTILKLILQKPN